MATLTLSPQQTELDSNLTTANYNSFIQSIPRKKLKREGWKYVPGGPGGGGHWVPHDSKHLSGRSSGSIPADKTEKSTPRRPRTERKRNAHQLTAPRTRRQPAAQPSFNSSADAVASADGYKPREERSWDEFHPDLDLEAKIFVFSANEVDGIGGDGQYIQDSGPSSTPPGHGEQWTPNGPSARQQGPMTTPRRRPGRPPGRRPVSDLLLNGLGPPPSPPVQRPVPLPSQNPKERLSLPKPSYRTIPSLDTFEQDKAVRHDNFVTKTMENLGFQKTDRFSRTTEREMLRFEELFRDEELIPGTSTQVEYDMDEQDYAWLDAYNKYRKENESLKDYIVPAILEVTFTQIEREWHALEKRIPKPNPRPPQTHRPRSSSSAAVNGEVPVQDEEQDSKCAICDDGDCENANAILFCDGCDVAVHQECYGVPYVPEGQWLCRKCQQVGKATTTCVFCPNTDGAFKLTTESKWTHLLCSIFIPEVTISNTTFMEPVAQVEKIPPDRWKLLCYICNQRMGACIQCGSRNCYQAFHVSCARRAKLYLKMKSSHGTGPAFDASILKAYCHKHVPPEWREEHDVETATVEAKSFYRREMKGRRWADSRQSALTIGTSQSRTENALDEMKLDDEAQQVQATPGQKKKRMEIQKRIWRLPSGAPIVPEVVCKAVETALQRFPFQRRREFVAEACKYWTLKREARRGAALLKRLQLGIETFSSFEIARRDFAALGPSGALKLERRIEFAKNLEEEMSHVRDLCYDVLKREELKLQDAQSLKAYVDTIYFPILPLLSPVLERAKKHDDKTGFFTKGLDRMQGKLNSRLYTSVRSFSTDLSTVLRSVVGMDEQDNEFLSRPVKDLALAEEQKEAVKVAKRILRFVQEDLEKAFRAEAQLARKPYEQQINDFQNLEQMLEAKSKAKIPETIVNDAETPADQIRRESGEVKLTNGLHPHSDEDLVAKSPARILSQTENLDTNMSGDADASSDSERKPMMNGVIDHENDLLPSIEVQTAHGNAQESLPSDHSESNLLTPLRKEGVLWCFENFEPDGLTVQDERWAGAERALSANLSEMDDADLQDLSINMSPPPQVEQAEKTPAKKTPTKKRKRARW